MYSQFKYAEYIIYLKSRFRFAFQKKINWDLKSVYL